MNGTSHSVVRCHFKCPRWGTGNASTVDVLCDCGQTFLACELCVMLGRGFRCLSCMANELMDSQLP